MLWSEFSPFFLLYTGILINLTKLKRMSSYKLPSYHLKHVNLPRWKRIFGLPWIVLNILCNEWALIKSDVLVSKSQVVTCLSQYKEKNENFRYVFVSAHEQVITAWKISKPESLKVFAFFSLTFPSYAIRCIRTALVNDKRRTYIKICNKSGFNKARGLNLVL